MFPHLSAPRIDPLGVQNSTPWTINCALLWRTWLARKHHNNLGNLKRSLVKAVAEIPVETVCAPIEEWPSVSRFVWRQRASILSGIIINKNLKILLINYLARKVDVLFHFPSRSQ
jgi:hypothetical protein